MIEIICLRLRHLTWHNQTINLLISYEKNLEFILMDWYGNSYIK